MAWRGGRHRVGSQAGRGALAGALATVAMSGVIALGRALGLFQSPPPKQITANAAATATDVVPASSPGFQATWMLAHLLYGAACGVAFALLRACLPAGLLRPGGLAFGLLVWAVSYLGLMPALKLYPWPWQDDPDRMATTIAAHAVFGLSLAEIDGRLDS